MIALDADAFIRAQKVIRQVENTPQFPGQPQERVKSVPWLKYGKTKTAITALQGTTLGTGTVTLYWVDRSGSAPVLKDTGTDIYAENAGGAIDAGKWVTIQTIDGANSIGLEFC